MKKRKYIQPKANPVKLSQMFKILNDSVKTLPYNPTEGTDDALIKEDNSRKGNGWDEETWDENIW